MPLLLLVEALLEFARMSDDNIIHFNPWRDFNDAAILVEPEIDPDLAQIAIFLEMVFGYCDGLIPLRGLADKGQDAKPNNVWIPADKTAPEKVMTFAAWAAREGAAVYVVPGTVAETGQARSVDVLQMQTVVVDLDAGNVVGMLEHLQLYLGEPTMVVQSGGRTVDGVDKLHVWWRLTEPAEGEAIARLCQLRLDIAARVGGDLHFRSAHQPIRVAGTIYQKNGNRRLVNILHYAPHVERDLNEFIEDVARIPTFAGVATHSLTSYHLAASASAATQASANAKPGIEEVLTTPVREGGEDAFSRFQGASAAIGHFVRMVHDGRITGDEGWEGICQYNAAMLRPEWPIERLKSEADRIWRLHEERHGPALVRLSHPTQTALPTHPLGALLDDQSPMPDDIIAPRLLTPGGMLVLGGAPKVGKSDFLINLLAHAAAGEKFLRFAPPRPLRVFYLQAEIQYHYLRERLQDLRIDAQVLARARDTLVATPKLKILLDEQGVTLVAAAIRCAFPDAPPDIICVDPLRNLFDGGPSGEGENDNSAMLFFLQSRVEALRDLVAPDAGLILCHHTKKLNKRQLIEDPFMALSGASALRSFYTSGMIMFRPEEDQPQRRLEIELRNGPALGSMLIDKRGGRWVELDARSERLVRKESGAKLDAERLRKRDVILGLIYDEAMAGRLYTAAQFAEEFENQAGLGGIDTIRDRVSVLATKSYVKFLRDASHLGLPYTRSKFGYLCVEEMRFPVAGETVDSETGEVKPATAAVLPTHYKCAQSGACLPVENPEIWVYRDGEDAQ